MSAFTLGLNTYTVPFRMHGENRERVIANLKAAGIR